MNFLKERLKYIPKFPKRFEKVLNISVKENFIKKDIEEDLKKKFKNTFLQKFLSFEQRETKKIGALKVAVVFSGGPAAGGHNVVFGIFESLKKIDPKSTLFGFLNGPKGILENKFIKITKKILEKYKNTGGFDLLGSSRTKIEKKCDLEKALQNLKNLDGLVIIGGDDSNTNAAILADFFLENNIKTRVIGVPKTIDGDLKNEYILTSFGFDTATKVYSEMIGNLKRDVISSKKYYHFIKLMGRSASHIALECALKTHAHYTIIGEEVFKKNKTIDQITKEIADVIVKRSKKDKNYGIILIPEGTLEFIAQIRILIKELNSILAKDKKINTLFSFEEKRDYLFSLLKEDTKNTLKTLSKDIQKQLLLTRDPHGNVKVSQIETEKLFIDKVKEELLKRDDFKKSFSAISHFFGYEARCSFPSNFDANYCYFLGLIATVLIKEKRTGYLACATNIDQDVENWGAMGIPLVSLMNMEERLGEKKPVIKKTLVDLDGKVFKYFEKHRNSWEIEESSLFPGPMQYFGPREITDDCPISIKADF